MGPGVKRCKKQKSKVFTGKKKYAILGVRLHTQLLLFPEKLKVRSSL